jgi:hypothetical protein
MEPRADTAPGTSISTHTSNKAQNLKFYNIFSKSFLAKNGHLLDKYGFEHKMKRKLASLFYQKGTVARACICSFFFSFSVAAFADLDDCLCYSRFLVRASAQL